MASPAKHYASRAAFATGTSALYISDAELSALRTLLPKRSVGREHLAHALAQVKLSNEAFADALFEISDFSNMGSPSTADVLTTYATLRRLSFTPSDDATTCALYLAFMSAGGAAGSLSFAQWSRFAGEIGITVGGVDCLPGEEAEANLRRRWRATKGRLRSLFSDFLTFSKFASLLKAGDAGVVLCLTAVGFVLTHAVIDFADAPVEKPLWVGDSDSSFLSQYMTYAIEQAKSSASATESPHGMNHDGARQGPSALTMTKTNDANSLETELQCEEFNSPNDDCSPEDSSLSDLSPAASPFPDVEKRGGSHRPDSSIGNSRSGHRNRFRSSRVEEHNSLPTANPSPSFNRASATTTKARANVIRRTRHVAGDSPFHIDYSSLKLGERIGSGAYGDVYRGTFLMSPVAIKMFHVNIARSAGVGPGIHGDQDSEDPSHMSRMMSMTALQRFASVNSQAKYKNFLREVEMMSVVRHPNLVLYMGACGDPVTPLCIVSELFTGGSLYEYLHDDDNFRPAMMTSIHFALSIARGMYYLHSSQPSILHRDLKSRNILLSGKKEDGDPHAVICDFGLCQLFGEDGQGSGSTPAMGTASYMSPDVINGEKYEAADDVYSYGILLYEIFTGSVPYKGSRAMQVMYRVSTEGLRPSSDRESIIPDGVRDLIQDCWAQNRAQRPSFHTIIESLSDIETTTSQNC